MHRWRILGIRFCIQPSFWIMNALFAFVIFTYVGAARGGCLFAYILIWVLSILACVLVHELGHVIAGRIFGQPGNITLTGLGGQAVGEYGELAVWQRILVIGAGPGAGFLFVAGLVIFDGNTTLWNQLHGRFLMAKTDSPFWGDCRVVFSSITSIRSGGGAGPNITSWSSSCSPS